MRTKIITKVGHKKSRKKPKTDTYEKRAKTTFTNKKILQVKNTRDINDIQYKKTHAY
jgi:hypothetical protein